jgi:mRNA interferase RelE/StbE
MSNTGGSTWQVILLREPKKVLARVPADLRRRLLTVLHGLEVEPRPNGCRKLRGHEDLYRLRVGDWRIVYGVQDDRLVVLVIEIAARGDAHRNL